VPKPTVLSRRLDTTNRGNPRRKRRTGLAGPAYDFLREVVPGDVVLSAINPLLRQQNGYAVKNELIGWPQVRLRGHWAFYHFCFFLKTALVAIARTAGGDLLENHSISLATVGAVACVVLLSRPGPIPAGSPALKARSPALKARSTLWRRRMPHSRSTWSHCPASRTTPENDTVQTIDGDFRSLPLFVLVKHQPNKVKRMMATWVIQ
jgi:hypothetical protein